jgi:hypothetical protein
MVEKVAENVAGGVIIEWSLPAGRSPAGSRALSPGCSRPGTKFEINSSHLKENSDE